MCQKKIIAILNLTYSVAIAILGFDHENDKVKYCWIKDGVRQPINSAKLHTKRNRVYFYSCKETFFIDEFQKI